MSNPSVESLRAAIRASEHSYTTIGATAGIKDRSYVRKFANGDIEDPSVSRFEAMREALEVLNGLPEDRPATAR